METPELQAALALFDFHHLTSLWCTGLLFDLWLGDDQ
jgi:hypothetical protein